MTNEQESGRRIASLQQRLQQADLDGALYLYPIDLYYLTATRQTATLWVPARGEPILFVRKSLQRAQQEAGIEDIRPFPRSHEFAAQIAGKKIGMTFDVIPVQQYQYYQKILPGFEFSDISTINRELRSLKSTAELERMRYAGVQLSRVFASMADFIRPGLREIDIAAEFESRLRQLGGEGLVRMRAFNQELFMGLAVAGPPGAAGGFFNGAATGAGLSAAAAHGASRSTVAPDQPIMLDYTGVFDGYIVDMTRTFVAGRLREDVHQAFQTAGDILHHLAARLKPGANCGRLYAEALEMAEEAGLADKFMGPSGEQVAFVGHGVGLELDEYPVLAQGFDVEIQAGQTLAVEPKFTFADQGIVGIENTYLVTPEGGEKITVLDDALITIDSAGH
jgi:Xaa-Pro aminopeptidase